MQGKDVVSEKSEKSSSTESTQAGKGDDYRKVGKNYEKNFEQIDWGKDEPKEE